MSEQTKNHPTAEIRDNNMKATIWKNQSENGPFYSVEVTRTYKDPASTTEKVIYANSHSFSGSDILRASNLLNLAYAKVLELQQQDYLAKKNAA